MLKKIGFLLFSFFLVWQSYSLVFLSGNLDNHSVPFLILYAWVITLFITGIFAFLVFGFDIQNILPDSYYKIHQPKKLKDNCAALKVDLFRKFLLATFWKSKKKRKEYFDGTPEGIDNLVRQSKKSEFGHLIPLVLTLLVSVYFLMKGHLILGLTTTGFNILGNFYPILLQRHHRMRISILRRRFSEKTNRK